MTHRAGKRFWEREWVAAIQALVRSSGRKYSMMVEMRECWCVRSTWIVHSFICEKRVCRKCWMRVPQVAWRWEGL